MTAEYKKKRPPCEEEWIEQVPSLIFPHNFVKKDISATTVGNNPALSGAV